MSFYCPLSDFFFFFLYNDIFQELRSDFCRIRLKVGLPDYLLITRFGLNMNTAGKPQGDAVLRCQVRAHDVSFLEAMTVRGLGGPCPLTTTSCPLCKEHYARHWGWGGGGMKKWMSHKSQSLLLGSFTLQWGRWMDKLNRWWDLKGSSCAKVWAHTVGLGESHHWTERGRVPGGEKRLQRWEHLNGVWKIWDTILTGRKGNESAEGTVHAKAEGVNGCSLAHK